MTTPVWLVLDSKQSSQLSVRTRTNTHKVDCNAAAVTAKSEKPYSAANRKTDRQMCSIYAPVDEWLGGADVARDPLRIRTMTARVEFPVSDADFSTLCHD